MTDVMERAEQVIGEHLDKDGQPCTNNTHWTAWAYRNGGCRSAEAEAQYLAECQNRAARNRARRRGQDDGAYRGTKQILNPSPSCPAPADSHLASVRGWDEGCRCAGAVYARTLQLESQRRATRRARNGADPRGWWLRPDMRCGRSDLWWLVQGVPRTDLHTGQPCNTQIERMAAVLRMTGRRHRSGLEWTDVDIARAIGVSHAAVWHLRRLPDKLRAKRTARRLAESQWRAMRNKRLNAALPA